MPVKDHSKDTIPT